MFTDKETFKKHFVQKLEGHLGKRLEEATSLDCYKTLGSLVREYVNQHWIQTNTRYKEKGEKQVYYFSMEFLLGRLMSTNLLNLGVLTLCQEALEELGFEFKKVLEQEMDAGLGNGGLGRLAACFLDSLASLQLPGHGCGIRYKYGLFEQKIIDGYQVELPDYWLNKEYVWEVRRLDQAVEVRFGGHVEVDYVDGRLVFEHKDYDKVLAVPYDVPMIGYQNKTVNTLRLWSAESILDLHNLYTANKDDYYKILHDKSSVESISEFLYPDDSTYEGRLLRLKQQYFLVSAGLQSILRSFQKQNLPIQELSHKISIHINDTHPTLIIPELMRILIDEKGLGWEKAWEITCKTVSYTNHTTLSEALEKWPVSMIQTLLPRMYMIMKEINKRFCQQLWDQYPGDFERIARLAVIADEQVRMAHLAIVGSHSVNGVAKIHTEILKKREMRELYEVYPHKFNNKTNGITHRRWLLHANPKLANLISEAIGTRWISKPKELIGIIKYASDAAFQEKIQQIKMENKKELATFIYEKNGITIDEHSIFDVQVKRLHGYKRQLLNVLHIMDLYQHIIENSHVDIIPRTFIFAAKAAPSYHFAKKVIKLINTVSNVINQDQTVKDKLKVVFLQNYSVSLAEKIIPATDVSEQISTASKEASGTGNMKFMMNGALTIGTLDGANVEMMEMMGKENMFIFGLTAEEVSHYYRHGGYHAQAIYNSDSRIRNVLDQLLDGGSFSNGESEFHDIYYSILSNNDEFFVLKDFDAYTEAQEMVDFAYRNQRKWLKKSIINMAHSGKFASDRTIAEYAAEIWKLRPVVID